MKGLDYEKDYSPVAYRKRLELLAGRTEGFAAEAVALFEYAYSLERAGFSELAKVHYAEIIDLAETIHATNRKVCSAFALAQVFHDHGKQLFNFGRFELAKVAFQRASELLQSQINHGVTVAVIEMLAESLHWLARSHRKLGEFDAALAAYSRSVPLLRNLFLFSLPYETMEKVHIMFHTAVYGYSKILREQKLRSNWSVH